MHTADTGLGSALKTHSLRRPADVVLGRSRSFPADFSPPKPLCQSSPRPVEARGSPLTPLSSLYPRSPGSSGWSGATQERLADGHRNHGLQPHVRRQRVPRQLRVRQGRGLRHSVQDFLQQEDRRGDPARLPVQVTRQRRAELSNSAIIIYFTFP